MKQKIIVYEGDDQNAAVVMIDWLSKHFDIKVETLISFITIVAKKNTGNPNN